MLGSINISLAALAAVLILIAIRQVGTIKLQIWQIMLSGAVLVLLTGEISPDDALLAINADVMIFLAGMFVIGEAMHESGYILSLSCSVLSKARDLDQLLLLILFGMGALSALLMNDTLAIIGTPLMIHLGRVRGISPKLLLLALAFGVTTGSAASPIGNPQNLLIALHGGLESPFQVFTAYLLLPSAINLFIAYLMLRIFYRRQFHASHLTIKEENLRDPGLASLAKASLILLLALIGIKVLFVLLGLGEGPRLSHISLLSAVPILLLSPRRAEVARRIDWTTLVFFASMFVLMESVWRSGVFQELIACHQEGLASVPTILALSVLASQIISNVPLVALCQPMIPAPSDQALMALAAGSTIAGNLFILGAASNVIIIQNAERSGETITFLEFARVGVPLTMLNVLIYYLFL